MLQQGWLFPLLLNVFISDYPMLLLLSIFLAELAVSSKFCRISSKICWMFTPSFAEPSICRMLSILV